MNMSLKLNFDYWPEIETNCSVLVRNSCIILGIKTMEELLRRAEKLDEEFLENFSEESIEEIETIREIIKEKKLVPPSYN